MAARDGEGGGGGDGFNRKHRAASRRWSTTARTYRQTALSSASPISTPDSADVTIGTHGSALAAKYGGGAGGGFGGGGDLSPY
eukprot:422071-Prymnesium_polylepis.1